MKKLVIIDGKSVFYRGYYAMRNLSLSDGTPTGGVYGFAAMMLEIIDKLRPDYAVVAWDKAKTSIRKRKEIYEGYKATRKAAPDDFYVQIPYLMELLTSFGVPLYECDDYEADDIIGTLARKAAAKGIEVALVSGDLDMLQIVDEKIHMYQMKKGFSEVERFDIAAIERKYGLKKEQFLDLKTLKGDPSDNIPGVPGIGEKNATKLLEEWGSVDNIYANLDKINNSLAKKLEEGRSLADISKRLSAIMFDAPVELNLTESSISQVDDAGILAALSKLEFRSLIAKYKKLRSKVSNLNINDDGKELEGASKIKRTLPDGLLIARDVKVKMHVDGSFAVKILAGEEFWDLGQVAFLLNPLQRAETAEQLGLNFDDPESLAEEYWQDQDDLKNRPELLRVIRELDFPLIPILYKMEHLGVKIDREHFKSLEKKFTEELAKVEQKIYNEAGREFNINSPMQLSEVLYEDLALPTKGIRRKQKFYSTGQAELEKLKGASPIIEEIERHRELSKLLTTYVRPLPDLADKQDRIHTTYTQNVTATGRLSSLAPNLQNIPVRKTEGRWIREGFVADEGKVFVSADYAQFELRLAAALADDEALISDFNAGLDIHTKTASDVFQVKISDVNEDQRRAAKVINFGVLYGMSAKGLSVATGMNIAEARAFIDDYFEVRKPIRVYLDKILEMAREVGYVETMFGRRRPTPDVKSVNFMIRSAAERAAMNMPIQGTEADLMKLAMVRLDAELPETANLILQVHDSLVVECKDGTEKEVADVMRKVMETVAPELRVKLAVDISSGKNWGVL